jgi:hypothetical protein
MTMRTRFLCAAAATAVAAFAATAPAQALTSQECSAKYQAAKSAGTLNGMKWNDFRKAQCSGEASPVAAPAAPPAAPPPPVAEAKPKAAAPAAPPAAPVATGNAVFPIVVDPKFASETPHMQRMHTCAAQWQMNKTNNATGGMHWNQKGGGGFYSVCNQRLKGPA